MTAGPAPLNEPQRKAAVHVEGPLLIFAGAGSGKTRTIIYRIANLIATHRVAPYRILAVTFTNKAAGEMRERLEHLAGPEIARDLWVGTFHGTCAKFLRRHHDAVGLERNFVIYDDSDQKAVVARVIKDLGLDDKRYAPKALRALISAAKRDGDDPYEVDLGDGFDSNIVEIGRQYQLALRRSNAVDFDDLLLLVLKIVEDPESPAGRDLRAKFSHVLVDEFQDTNMVQYRIVRALTAATRNLCVVGDDDQSIYRWRGADVRIIRGFKHDFSEAEVIKLEQNYRSAGNIVAAALGVIAPANDREPKELWTAEPPGQKIQIRACTDERVEAAYVVGDIQAQIRNGSSAGEQAVFYRTHAQSRVLEEGLRGAGVPYQIIGGMKFFERAEVKDMLSYLRLIANPASDTDFLRIVNVPARGVGQKTVARLLELAAENASCLTETLDHALLDQTLSGGAAKKLVSFSSLLKELRAASETLSPADLLERTLDSTGYKAILEKEDTAESDARLQNLAELVGSLREYEQEAPLTGEEVSLAGYLERVSLVAAVDTLENLPQVSLMTVHSSKGLEFDNVWITGMEEETFPFRGLDGEDPEELDEERRLAYVAITRARKRLVITHAGTRFLFGRTKYLSPSRFLDDIPDDCCEHSGETRPQLAGFMGSSYASGSSGGHFGTSAQRSSWGASSFTRSNWGATRARPGPTNEGEAVSPAGRKATRQIEIPRRHDTGLDDVAPDDFYQESYDETESVIVRPGQKVRHKKFGKGVVERVESGATPTVVARFPGYGPKRIIAEFLEFEG
jgi:DNA helicase II / ATP-dependent DNA helicase PcrA